MRLARMPATLKLPHTGNREPRRKAGLFLWSEECHTRRANRVRLGYDDATRTELAIKGAEGKRLTYKIS